MQYDAAGNLIGITNPDGSQTSWEYDDKHHLTANVDPLGNRGQDFYDFAGRSTGAIRKDGTTVQVQPVEVQGLYRPEQTSDVQSFYHPELSNDPMTAPPTFQLSSTTATQVDGDGNVSTILTDRAGQLVSSGDAQGQKTSVTRNTQNLISTATDSLNHRVSYTYDSKGNLTSTSETLLQDAPTSSIYSNPITLYRSKGNQFADVNGDGFLDLIGAYSGSDQISISLGKGNGQYLDSITYSIGSGNLDAITFGDINHDNKLDIVLSKTIPGQYVPGTGGGGGGVQAASALFASVQTLDAPLDPAIMTGSGYDNGYFTPDQYDVTILYGYGDGTFAPGVDSPITYQASKLLIADLNQDHNDDLIVGNRQQTGGTSIYLNNGQGGFGLSTTFDLGIVDDYLASADLNHDGKIDLINTNYFYDSDYNYNYNLSVRLGNGDGTFDEAQVLAIDPSNSNAKLLDFYGDGELELVTPNYNTQTISVFRGLDNLATSAHTDYGTGLNINSFAIGDINHDGKLDIVGLDNRGNLTTLLSQNSSYLANQTSYALGGGISNLSLQDFNNDNSLDLVLNTSDGLEFLANTGDGHFNLPSIVTPLNTPVFSSNILLVGDLNNDGKADLVLVDSGSDGNEVVVKLGQGDGTFLDSGHYLIAPISQYGYGQQFYSLSLADINKDGIPDIVAGYSLYYGSTNLVSAILGKGDGTFSSFRSFNAFSAGGSPTSIAVADLNGDSTPDLAIANQQQNTVTVSRGHLNPFNSQNPLSFNYPQSIAVGSRPTSIAIGDLNGDGRRDIVTANSGSNTITILSGQSDGSFTRMDYSVGLNPTSVTLSDLNLDGYLDILVTYQQSKTVSVLLGQAGGGFLPSTDYQVGQVSSLAVADVNGDSHLDVLTSNGDNFSVLLGNGDGTLQNEQVFVTPNYFGTKIAVADFNGDKAPDVIEFSSSYYNNGIVITFNSGSTLNQVKTSYTYDPVFNKLTSSTDELGHKTLFEIDLLTGNVLSTTKVVGAVGGSDDLVTHYAYNNQGLITQEIDPLGHITVYDYDVLGRLIQVTAAKGTPQEVTRQYEYDAAGNQTALIDENGNQTSYVYDAMDRVVKVIKADPDGTGPLSSPIQSYTYDLKGNLTSMTDSLGRTTTYAYDALNRLTLVTDALGNAQQYQYDKAGNIIAIIDPLGHITQYRYDSRNRRIEAIDAAGNSTKFTYDTNNNLTSQTDALGRKTLYTYDQRNRLIRKVDPLHGVLTYAYDAVGNLVTETDENGNQTRLTYDELNRQTQSIDALGDVTTFSYDKDGNLIANTDALGHTTTYSYDALNRLTTQTNALGGTLKDTYDKVGNLITQTDELNRTTTYTYDALNRETSVVDPLNHATTYSYDSRRQ